MTDRCRTWCCEIDCCWWFCACRSAGLLLRHKDLCFSIAFLNHSAVILPSEGWPSWEQCINIQPFPYRTISVKTPTGQCSIAKQSLFCVRVVQYKRKYTVWHSVISVLLIQAVHIVTTLVTKISVKCGTSGHSSCSNLIPEIDYSVVSRHIQSLQTNSSISTKYTNIWFHILSN